MMKVFRIAFLVFFFSCSNESEVVREIEIAYCCQDNLVYADEALTERFSVQYFADSLIFKSDKEVLFFSYEFDNVLRIEGRKVVVQSLFFPADCAQDDFIRFQISVLEN